MFINKICTLFENFATIFFHTTKDQRKLKQKLPMMIKMTGWPWPLLDLMYLLLMKSSMYKDILRKCSNFKATCNIFGFFLSK